MKLYLSITSAVLSVILLISNSLIFDQSDLESKLLGLNRNLTESMIMKQDGELLMSVSNPGYFEIAPGGVIESREQIISDLWAFSTVDSISIENERFIKLGSTAVVTNRLVIFGPIQGPIGEIGPMTMISTFGKDGNGDWKIISRAYSICAPEAINLNLC